METLLDELFVLDDQETNEETIKQYAIKNSITLTWPAQIRNIIKLWLRPVQNNNLLL